MALPNMALPRIPARPGIFWYCLCVHVSFIAYDLFCAATAMAAAQFASTLMFFRKMRREFASPVARHHPSLAVLLPCKGAPERFESDIRSLLDQDYPGALEFIFVTPSESDPAYVRLKSLLAQRSGASAILLASNARPTRSSGWITDVFYALDRARPQAEVLLFAVTDQQVTTSWAREMVAPLADPAVVLATSTFLYVPERKGLWNLLRMAWMGYGIPYFILMDGVDGASLAMRRKDFEELGVRGIWEGTITNDLALAAKARGWGRQIRFVTRAMTVCRESFDFRQLYDNLSRWVLYFRVYDLRFWGLGAVQLLVKLWILTWAVRQRAWPLAAYALLADALNLYFVFRTFRRFLPERFTGINPAYRRFPLLAALYSPLVLALYVLTYLRSACSSDIHWGGVHYRIHGPREVEVVTDAQACGASRVRRLGRAGLVVLAGCALGAGCWPGPWGALSWFVFVPLLWAIRDETPGRSFLWGWLFGGAWFAAGVPWLLGVTQRWLNIPMPEPAFWFAAMCAYHGLIFALACGAARWLGQAWQRRRAIDPAAATAAAFIPAVVAAEGLVPMLFPAQLANTQFFHLPSVQIVSVLGMAGLAWLIAAFNAAVFLCLESWGRAPALFRRRLALAAGAAALLAANEAWGRRRMRQIDAQTAVRIAQGRALRVGMVQGPLSYEHDNLYPLPLAEIAAQNLPAYTRLSRPAAGSGGLDLLIWPGNIYPGPVEYGPQDGSEPRLEGSPLADALRARMPFRIPLLSCGVGSDPGGEHTICLLNGASQRPLGAVEKRTLTPFADYMPCGRFLPVLRRISPNTRALARGRRQKLLELPGRARLGVLICYEDFMAEDARRFVRLGADLFVDRASDAWADDTMVPGQHLLLAAMRAVENGRYLLRVTDSGVSAVVDPAGRILQSIAPRQEGVIVATVALLEERTPYIALGRGLYLLAVLLLLGAALPLLVVEYRAQGRPKEEPCPTPKPAA
ncbi:MAG: apolipoprotein N-acyltransferase [Elusimicrobia bacterium]|nr:apolipoprotein N-acyltransferase [Elusimicrobiota bacterium]